MSASMPNFTAPTRPASGGVVALALGAIENALLDAKAKALGVPCYELLGGKIRDRIRVYWSHCATWRINHPDCYKPAITDLDGVKAIGREVRDKGFTALKTNIFTYDATARTARLAARLRLAVRARAQCRPQRAAQSAHAPRSDARRRRAGRRHPARPQLQRQDRRLSEDPARDRRPRHVLDRDRQLQPRSARLHPPAEPASDLVLRDAARPARIPALLPRAGDGRRHHRHAVERRLAVDEDRGRRRGARGQRRAAQLLRPPVHA